MGIPFFYMSLIRQHSGIVKPIKNIQTDILCIDFNCLIHKYLKDSEPIQSVLDGLELIMKLCNSKKTIIYLDGLVPYSKMIQQRYRRFRIKETAIFDRNQISPDTPYMRELEKELEKYPIEISGTLKAGEGVQKLFKNLKSFNEKNIVVYGLDADLILLSLYHSKKFTEFYLLRESQELNCEGEFSLLNIKLLCKLIPIEIEQFLYLCILCFGNDFMPNLGLFSLRDGGYQRALDIYNKSGSPNLKLEEGRYKFLQESEKIEWEFYQKRKNPFERYVIGKDKQTFSKKYNLHVLDGLQNIEKVVESFWKTFHWTIEYFIENKSTNWNWAYMYPDAPLIMDILEFYETSHKSEKHSMTLSKHLAFILPSKSLLKRHKKFEDEWYSETRPLWIKKHEWESKPFLSLPWHPTDSLTSIKTLNDHF